MAGVMDGEGVALVVENLMRHYDSTVAVADLSFSVGAGEILGLLGANGAGKTTILRCLAGILRPTAGRISICGHDLERAPIAAKAALAYIPDEPRLFEQLTVWEHLRFAAGAFHLGKDWTGRAEVLLQQFELTDKRNSLGAELSRGMRQKVAICCAYLHAPRLMLFDEPLTGLDPRGIRTLKDSIRQGAANGAAIIVSSHLLSLVEDLCTAVLILRRGRQVLRGTWATLNEQLAVDADRETLEELFFRLTESPSESLPLTPPTNEAQ